MRYLILTDIHANWEALEAVLADAEGSYERVVCCGDIVGYCADPNRVTEWARNNVEAIVRGNHDKAVFAPEILEWFNPVARSATLWTQRELTPANLDYLRALPKGPVPVGDFQIFHGSPFDEDDYIVSPGDALQLEGYLAAPVSFFGHSHLQGGFLLGRRAAQPIAPVGDGRREAVLEIADNAAYLINPGSVGQPRDSDPRAAYALYDTAERLVTYRRVDYDLAKAQQKIVQAGLPEVLALRLAIGA